MIIGVIGKIGSGKDTVADYILRKYFYDMISFRDVVKEVTEKEGLKPDRENMQNIGKKYRQLFGQEYFTKIVLGKIEKCSNEKILVKEMRTEDDLKLLKEKFVMKIIQVITDTEIRFQRLKKRGRLGDPKKREEFDAQEKKEEKLGYTKALEFTDIEINNNNNFDDLYKKIDKLFYERNF